MEMTNHACKEHVTTQALGAGELESVLRVDLDALEDDGDDRRGSNTKDMWQHKPSRGAMESVLRVNLDALEEDGNDNAALRDDRHVGEESEDPRPS